MADVALDCTQAARGGQWRRAVRRVNVLEGHLQAIDLDRVAQRRPRAVHLDVTQTGGVDASLAPGRLQQFRLSLGIGRGQRIGPATMVLRTGANDAVNVVTRRFRRRELFQQ